MAPREEITFLDQIWDTIVLGAGASGMVASSLLSTSSGGRKAGSVLLIDTYPRLGGNHIDVDIGPYSFDIGSFFFSDQSRFLKHFPELIPHYDNQERGTYAVARITPDLKLAHYPVDPRADILGHGPLMPVRFAASALYGRLFVNESGSAEDFARHWIGGLFFRHTGLRHYMQRLFGLNPALIEGSFAQKRMQWVKKNAQLRQVVGKVARRRTRPGTGPQERLLVRPRSGFDSLYRIAKEVLERRGVSFLLGTGLTRIDGTAEAGFTLRLVDGRQVRCRRLISTIPLTETLPLCGLAPPTELRALDLLSLFVTFSGRRGFDQNVLYNFSFEGQWKRLTMHSDFYGRAEGREYLSLECTVPAGQDSPEARFAEFRALARKAGIFDGDLRLAGHRVTANAYPVYLKGATAAAETAIGQLRAMGITSLGRQGGFDYQPTAGVSALEAERLLSTVPETARM